MKRATANFLVTRTANEVSREPASETGKRSERVTRDSYRDRGQHRGVSMTSGTAGWRARGPPQSGLPSPRTGDDSPARGVHRTHTTVAVARDACALVAHVSARDERALASESGGEAAVAVLCGAVRSQRSCFEMLLLSR